MRRNPTHDRLCVGIHRRRHPRLEGIKTGVNVRLAEITFVQDFNRAAAGLTAG